MQLDEVLLGRYKVIDLLASGNQAELAKAVDLQTGAVVAVKRLATPPGVAYYDAELARFQRMGRLRIGHRNVVDPIDCGEENGEWYVVMPFIEGCDLDAYRAARGGRLTADESLRLTRLIAQGLSAIHLCGVVHRDLKPANIVVQPDGTLCILDLGICRITNEATITQGSGILGSLPWMPPEQLNDVRQVDHRADLYSAGAIAYWMATGRAPIEGQGTEQVVRNILLTPPDPPRSLDPSISEQFERIVMRLLEKSPDARFQTAVELIQAIDSQADGAVRFCTLCGCRAHASARYCPRCGAVLANGQVPTVRCFACGADASHGPACPSCGVMFGAANHRLEFRAGPLAGNVFRIPEGIFDVGRDQLSPRDHFISRRQLRVAAVNGTVHLQNASATNPTKINGQPADQPMLLAAGHEITFGLSVAVYGNH